MTDKPSEYTIPDDEVTQARIAIGLPRDRFVGLDGGVNRGMPIVCRCIHCGTLFRSLSHNLADLDHICKGDCCSPAVSPPITHRGRARTQSGEA